MSFEIKDLERNRFGNFVGSCRFLGYLTLVTVETPSLTSTANFLPKSSPLLEAMHRMLDGLITSADAQK